MRILFEQDEITQADIQSLIDNHLEETPYLEFKRADALSVRDDRKRHELSKDVSAFANADGGVIVYGIEEVEHVAQGLSFVDGRVITKEWLSNVISSRVHRRIDRMRIMPVRFDGLLEQSIYVVRIDASPFAPHMASDKRYYRRNNFEAVPMEEYEVRALYFRGRSTVLTLGDPRVTVGYSVGKGRFSNIEFAIYFPVINQGMVAETSYKVEIWIPDGTPFSSLEPNPLHGYMNRRSGNHTVYSLPNKEPIFPNEDLTAVRFTVSVTSRNFAFFENTDFRIMLYYSAGREEHIVRLADFFVVDGRKFTANDLIDTRGS